MDILETKTATLKVEQLVPNEGQLESIGVHANPRTISDDDYRALVESMKKDNMTGVMPLKVFEHEGTFVVLGGNMRLRALKELGMQEVACIVVPKDTDAETLNKIIITDNSTFGDWDMDMLANDWDADDLNTWGLDVPYTPTENAFGTDFSLSNDEKCGYRKISFQVTDKQADLLLYALSAVTYSDAYQEFDKDGNDNDNGNAITLFASNWIKESLSNISDLEKEKAMALQNIEKLKTYLREALQASGKPAKEVDRVLGTAGMSGHYFGDSQWMFPTRDAYEKMRTFMDLPKPYEECALLVRRCNYILNLVKK